ncbi:MAG: hypothetical protein FLDDKLPJ_03751 [Phycisphaerae bacterium]|nr:hypothetical protein [Phycisphaerae bacterium]
MSIGSRVMRRFTSDCSLAATAFVLTFAGTTFAGDIGDYGLRGVAPLPSAGAFQDMFDVHPDGRVIVVAANDVYVETSPGARRFEPRGGLPGGGGPVSYPAFVRVSPDGTRFAVGNSFDAVGVFDVETLAGAWFFVGHYDAEWFDDVHLAIRDAGDMTLLDTTSDPKAPVNPRFMTGGPFSAGVAFDGAGNLYTGTGLTTGGPSQTGWVKGFTRARWQSAVEGAPPIDYEAEGVQVCDVLSAASLGFDVSGNLHVGGGDFDSGDVDALGVVAGEAIAAAWRGEGPADNKNPDEVRRVDPDAANDFNWYDATYNAALGELLVRDAWTSFAYVYTAGSGVTCEEVRAFRARCSASGRVRARVRLSGETHDGVVLYATLDGVPHQAEAAGRKARWSWRGVDAGEHTVVLTDPADCGAGVTVTCP